jgi:anaerobic selenocysteine-containing dehydrogenase
MSQWHQTGCVLCAQNCGLKVMVENNRMVKVRSDKDNPRSEGYACRKGFNVIYHQYPKERLTEPLKRVDGRFEPLTWEQAIAEIAAKMRKLVDQHGPRCLAYMGGGAQGGHMEAGFGLSVLRAMGSQYFYSPAGHRRLVGKRPLLRQAIQRCDSRRTRIRDACGLGLERYAESSDAPST